MSPEKYLITAIQDRIRVKVNPAYIDIYQGESSFSDASGVADYPAVFVDVPEISWSGNRDLQKGTALIDVYYQSRLTEHSFQSSDERENALEVYEEFNKLYLFLDGFGGVGFSSLSRKFSRKVQFEKTTSILLMTFSTIVTQSKNEDWGTVTPKAKVIKKSIHY